MVGFTVHNTMKTTLFILFVIIFAAPRVFACSCMTPEISKMVEHADLIFFGQSYALMLDDPLAESFQSSLTAQFEITKILKGELEAGEAVEIQTATESSMCGFNFRVGRYYIVYAFNRGDRFHTDICTRTREAGHPSQIKYNEELIGILDVLGDDSEANEEPKEKHETECCQASPGTKH